MKQKYRMTFKCSECFSVFEKITTKQNLMNPPCPDCKKTKLATKLHRVGDGAVSDNDLLKVPFERAPNVIYKCESCETKIKIFEQPEEKMDKCPNCDSKQIKFVCHIDRYISQAAKTQNKAIDVTADIVMEDNKLTNLPDKKMQLGETMAPRLDPVRQNMADNMFAKKKGPMVGFDLGTGRAAPIAGRSLNMGNIAKAAMSGAYSRGGIDPVAAVQNIPKPKISYVNRGN